MRYAAMDALACAVAEEPAEECADSPAARKAECEEAELPDVPALETTVLVVDDEPAVREILRDFLKDEGYSVVLATNGIEAIRKAGRGVDIIIMDVNMPDMSGIETSRYLAACRATAHIPVLFLSGSGDIPTKAKAFRTGAYDFMDKPVHMAELFRKVGALNRLVKRSGAGHRLGDYGEAIELERERQETLDRETDRVWFAPF